MKNTLFLAMLLALASCGTKRAVTDNTADSAGTSDGNATATAFVRGVQANNPTAEAITGKLSMDLNIDSKNVALTGSLKMKRNDVIQLSLTLLFVEVARIEFTPQDVLIIDRVRKQYVRATYDEVGFLVQSGLNFHALQALFWHELFVPGSKSDKLQPERFQLSSAGEHTLLTVTDAPRLNYEFLCTTAGHLIDRLNVEGKTSAERGRFVCRYGDFTQLEGKPYPARISLNISGTGRDVSAEISLSSLSTDAKWDGHTAPSSKYRERKASEILKSLF